ncbi:MAG: hypothetical protein FWE30_03100 [Bacteroidales bacterium]|nr:hypothetical protein [Bacteroidales bacterium]
MTTKLHIVRTLCATAVLLLVACDPIMDAPEPGAKNDPTRPNAPPQVIFMPEGIEADQLAVCGDYLYVTAPAKDQVYRFRITDLNNLSLVSNAVPYVKVPGAKGIVADGRGGLYIGSSAADSPASAGFAKDPPYGPLTQQWSSDQVIYFTHTSESWHLRFQNNPAQKLFIAPRGNFNALAWYPGSGSRRYEGGLYFAASNNVEGMGIGSYRYMESLNAVTGLIPAELEFLIQLAFGQFGADDLDINEILRAVRMINLALNTDGINFDTGEINWEKLALDNLLDFIRPTLAGPGIRFDVIIRFTDMFMYFSNGSLGQDILYGGMAFAAAALLNGGNNEIRIGIPMPPLYLEPQWGLNLATLWSPVDLELPYGAIEDLLLDYIGPNGEMPLSEIVYDALASAFGTATGEEWYHYILDYLAAQAGFIAQNIVSDRANLLALLSNYVTEPNPNRDTPISINNYKDQPAEYPPRPYLLPDLAGVEHTAPWSWNISNLSERTPRPSFLGYPMTPNLSEEVMGGTNTKLALTLYLLQFSDGSGGSFSLIQNKPQVDAFVSAISSGGILDQIKNIVNALEFDLILDHGVFDNPQLEAYLRFVRDLARSSDADLVVVLEDVFELISAFGIQIDFAQLLDVWLTMPDWTPVGGTRVGWIAGHELLGGLYEQLDNFVDNQSGLIGTLARWVSSRIPRVNSANGWSYELSYSGNPTGIAFGYDDAVQGVVGWVVDNKRLYTRAVHMPQLGGSYSFIRDDYPWKNADGSIPYQLNGENYHPPNSSFWTQLAGNRNRWTSVTIPGSGQTPTIVPQSVVLNNCYGVVYDSANQRVLVSCNDGDASRNKGRIVSVKYRSLASTGPTFACSGFFPPPPRIQIGDIYYEQIIADFSGMVQEYIPADGTLNNPKGMAIKDGYLFIADGDRIVVYYMGPAE